MALRRVHTPANLFDSGLRNHSKGDKMKGSREYKHFVSKHIKYLKAGRWDCLYIMKLERCKKKFVRIKKPTEYELQ